MYLSESPTKIAAVIANITCVMFDRCQDVWHVCMYVRQVYVYVVLASKQCLDPLCYSGRLVKDSSAPSYNGACIS